MFRSGFIKSALPTRLLFGMLVLLFVGGLFATPTYTHAQAPGGSTAAAGTTAAGAAAKPNGDEAQRRAVDDIQRQDSFLQRTLWSLVASVFGFLTWVTGGLLDWTIENFILDFGKLFTNSGLGVAVNSLWSIIRDLFNIGFIFGLVFAGLRLVWNADSSGARKTVASIVIAALLINFSLFATKLVIDFSNIAAVQISQLIYSNNQATAANVSISLRFNQVMGLPTIFQNDPASRNLNSEGNNSPSGGYIYIFGTMILLVIAAFCFAAGAILVIHRFIVLNFLMIFSPVMFLGHVFPKFSSYTSDFWNRLFKTAFFAPAFLLMLYFSLYVLQTMRNHLETLTGGRGLSLADAFMNTGASVTAVSTLILGAGFLIGSVIVAQKMAGSAGQTVMNVGKNLQGRGQRMLGSAAGGATFGLGARVSQRTIGQAGHRLANSAKMKDWAARSSVGAAALKASKKVGDTSFDARSVVSGVGKPTKGGYSTRVKEAADADKKFADSLGENKVADKTTAENRAKREKQLAADKAAIIADNATEGTNGFKYKEATAKLTEATTEVENVQRQIAWETQTQRTRIEQIRTDMEGADPIARRDMEKEIADNDAEIRTITNRYKSQLDVATNNQKSATASLAKVNADIESEAEARHTYARQLAFIDRRKSGRSLSRGLGTVATLGATAAGSALTGGILTPLGLAVVGTGIVTGSSGKYSSSIEELEKTYGRNGTKKVKQKKDKEAAKKLLEAAEEASEKKEEKSDDKKEAS